MAAELLEAPLEAHALTARWRALCADPTFEDFGKIELTQWGEILVSPVGKQHALLASEKGAVLRAALGGRTMVEVGILTELGVRAPDLARCSDAWLEAHPEDAPLASAPELCIEILSPTNSIIKLREKAAAFVRACAMEAWILLPEQRAREVYGSSGRLDASSFPIEVEALFEAPRQP